MKKLIYLLMMTVALTACGSLQIEKKMRDVELGMTKRQVVSILGNNYESAGARQTQDGDIETIRYSSLTLTEKVDQYFILSFKDGKLVEWFKEKYPIHAHGVQPNH